MEKTSSRRGVEFKPGNPYIGVEGTSFHWPGKVRRDFERRKMRLALHLLERVGTYDKEFGLRIGSNYPRPQIGGRAVIIHIEGSGGRWMEFWSQAGYPLACGHNLDFTDQNILCFNLGSDCLEFFDKKVSAPRIHQFGGKFEIKYALPFGELLLPSLALDPKTLGNIMGMTLGRLGKILEVSQEGNLQRINFERAKISVSNGIIRAETESAIRCSTIMAAKLADIPAVLRK